MERKYYANRLFLCSPKRKTEAEIAAIMAEDAEDIEKAHKLEAEAHINRVQSNA